MLRKPNILVRLIAITVAMAFSFESILWANPEILRKKTVATTLQVLSPFDPANLEQNIQMRVMSTLLGVIHFIHTGDEENITDIEIDGNEIENFNHSLRLIAKDTRINFNFDKEDADGKYEEEGKLIVPCDVKTPDGYRREYEAVIYPGESINKIVLRNPGEKRFTMAKVELIESVNSEFSVWLKQVETILDSTSNPNPAGMAFRLPALLSEAEGFRGKLDSVIGQCEDLLSALAGGELIKLRHILASLRTQRGQLPEVIKRLESRLSSDPGKEPTVKIIFESLLTKVTKIHTDERGAVPLPSGEEDGNDIFGSGVAPEFPDVDIIALAESIAKSLKRNYSDFAKLGDHYKYYLGYAYEGVKRALKLYNPDRNTKLKNFIFWKGLKIAIDEMRKDGVMLRVDRNHVKPKNVKDFVFHDRSKITYSTSEPTGIPDSVVAENRRSASEFYKLWMKKVSPIARLIIVLHYFEKLNFRKIGAALCATESSIARQHLEIIKKIKGIKNAEVNMLFNSSKVAPGFGKRIKKAMEELGINKWQLARTTSTRVINLDLWLKDKYFPKFNQWFYMIQAFKVVPASYLLRGENEPDWDKAREEFLTAKPLTWEEVTGDLLHFLAKSDINKKSKIGKKRKKTDAPGKTTSKTSKAPKNTKSSKRKVSSRKGAGKVILALLLALPLLVGMSPHKTFSLAYLPPWAIGLSVSVFIGCVAFIATGYNVYKKYKHATTMMLFEVLRKMTFSDRWSKIDFERMEKLFADKMFCFSYFGFNKFRSKLASALLKETAMETSKHFAQNYPRIDFSEWPVSDILTIYGFYVGGYGWDEIDGAIKNIVEGQRGEAVEQARAKRSIGKLTDSDKDALDALDLPHKVTWEQIHRRYRQLSLKYHPDTYPGAKTDPRKKKEAEEKFKAIQKAYEKLNNGRVKGILGGKGKKTRRLEDYPESLRKIIAAQVVELAEISAAANKDIPGYWKTPEYWRSMIPGLKKESAELAHDLFIDVWLRAEEELSEEVRSTLKGERKEVLERVAAIISGDDSYERNFRKFPAQITPRLGKHSYRQDNLPGMGMPGDEFELPKDKKGPHGGVNLHGYLPIPDRSAKSDTEQEQLFELVSKAKEGYVMSTYAARGGCVSRNATLAWALLHRPDLKVELVKSETEKYFHVFLLVEIVGSGNRFIVDIFPLVVDQDMLVVAENEAPSLDSVYTNYVAFDDDELKGISRLIGHDLSLVKQTPLSQNRWIGKKPTKQTAPETLPVSLDGIGTAEGLSKNWKRNVLSAVFSGRKIIAAFHRDLGNVSEDHRMLIGAMDAWKKRMKRKFPNLPIDNFIIIKEYGSRDELRDKLINGHHLEKDDLSNEKNIMLTFALENTKPIILGPIVHSVYLKGLEDGQFSSEQHYWPIIEVMTVSVVKAHTGCTTDTIYAIFEKLGIGKEEMENQMNIADIKEKDGALIVTIIGRAEKHDPDGNFRNRHAFSMKFLRAA